MSFKFAKATVNKDGTDGMLVNISMYPNNTGKGQIAIACRAVEFDDTGKEIPGAERHVELMRAVGKEDGEAMDDELITLVQNKLDEIATLVKPKFG